MEEEDDKMKLATNSSSKLLSDHPNYKRKVPRLSVDNGVVKVDLNDAVQRDWLEKFKNNK